ncbi:MAG: J domain-containing protein [Treponema sp.]|nr:J domain-containing protein [Treponema sp.]
MENYYSLLGVPQAAGSQEIKKAFRDKAKHLHPDIAGEEAAEKMRKLITAYEVLLDQDRRFEYDRAYSRFSSKYQFDYRTFLREQEDNPECQATLVFFQLLHLEEDDAIAVWEKQGGLDFRMEKYLDREDWMDCVFMIAEELDKRQRYYEAFVLLLSLIREERRRPYFKHFMEEVENFFRELVRLRLKPTVDTETWASCLEELIGLGFSGREEARWMRSLAEALISLGETGQAVRIFREALARDPALPNVKQLKKKLNVS